MICTPLRPPPPSRRRRQSHAVAMGCLRAVCQAAAWAVRAVPKEAAATGAAGMAGVACGGRVAWRACKGCATAMRTRAPPSITSTSSWLPRPQRLRRWLTRTRQARATVVGTAGRLALMTTGQAWAASTSTAFTGYTTGTAGRQPRCWPPRRCTSSSAKSLTSRAGLEVGAAGATTRLMQLQRRCPSRSSLSIANFSRLPERRTYTPARLLSSHCCGRCGSRGNDAGWVAARHGRPAAVAVVVGAVASAAR
mmetsp:Transcript_69646/g.194678  ORF Transcript_69646/g.194678 Transcript_69646/m.194678 type:complete len:251 (+) Transcript_69646:1062-1814(+)